MTSIRSFIGPPARWYAASNARWATRWAAPRAACLTRAAARTGSDGTDLTGSASGGVVAAGSRACSASTASALIGSVIDTVLPLGWVPPLRGGTRQRFDGRPCPAAYERVRGGAEGVERGGQSGRRREVPAGSAAQAAAERLGHGRRLAAPRGPP